MPRTHKSGSRRRGRLKTVVLIILLVVIGVASVPAGRYLWASLHYRRAIAAIERRDFGAARAHLDVCMREWPESAETVFLAARTARRAGELDEAQRLLKEAKRLNWVREAIDLEEALLAVQNGEYRAVVGYLMSCVRRDHPDSQLILEILVPAALRAYDLRLANECLEQWLRLEPNNPQPYIHKGDICERLRQKEEALKNYQEAARVAPENFDARLRCARMLIERNLPDQALPHYEWLVRTQPENAEVAVGLARCRHDLGQDDEARKLLSQIQERHADSVGAMTLRGLIELDSGHPAKAETWFRQACAQDPYALHLLHNLARCLDQLGKSAEAETLRKRMEDSAKDQEQATKLLRQIAARPGDPDPRQAVAEILMRNGLEQEAKRWLESALQLEPGHVPSLESLANYFDRRGDLSRAKEYRQLAQQYRQRK